MSIPQDNIGLMLIISSLFEKNSGDVTLYTINILVVDMTDIDGRGNISIQNTIEVFQVGIIVATIHTTRRLWKTYWVSTAGQNN
ncbi:hypothetical protein [Candidatus Ruthturnera calyptogenae]|uniref:hypothetical protein n=1 Tax=Candidatus Ruthturnera calyptogenae TaxID=386487 RepID=UPI0004645FCD|nr:hypothetical protein [Candidatus Ruthturnera calyptogenae]